MKTENAVKKLEKAGFNVISNAEAENGDGFYSAVKDGVTIQFTSNQGKVRSFSYNSETSSAPTFGLTLKAAMN